jgi:hypothetical protein
MRQQGVSLAVILDCQTPTDPKALMMAHSVGRRAGCGAYSLDREFYIDLAGFFESQRCLEWLSPLDRLLKVRHHNVKCARLELDRCARLYFQPGWKRPHFHHALIHTHFMDLKSASYRRRAAHQSVGLRARVFDYHVAARDLRAVRNGAGRLGL